MPATRESAVEERIVQTRTERQMQNHGKYMTRAGFYTPKMPVKPECPAYLGARGAKMWNTILDPVEDMPLLPTVAAQLEVYIHLYIEWHRIRRRIEREGYFDQAGNGNRLLPLFHSITDRMTKQYRVMYIALSNKNSDTTFVQKLEAAAEEVESQSVRGSLIGGERMAA